jgi:hypothetical protein
MSDIWYFQDTSFDQALVMSETTGENIAVVYHNRNAPLIAAAPELLAACEMSEYCLSESSEIVTKEDIGRTLLAIRDAIARLKRD